jgi:amino acid adenylation domain-containing protein
VSEEDAAAVLADLHGAGITLWLEDGRLRFRAPAGAMTPERRASVGLHKPAIIALLQSGQTAPRTEYPLSASQSRFLMIEQMVDVGATHTIGGAAWLSGPLSVSALQAAWQTTVDAHPALRTRFAHSPDGPRQTIAPCANAPLILHDHVTAEAAEAEAIALVSAPIDPFEGPCVTGHVWRLDEKRAVLGVALHHAIGDGWSVGVLLDDLASAYRQALGGGPVALPPRPGYAALLARQGPRDHDKAREWWRQHLADWPDSFELPTDTPRPAVQSFSGDVVSTTLEAAQAAGVRALARDLGISTFSVLAGLFAAVLMRLAGTDRMVLGVGVSGRDMAGSDRVIGPFVNTLPLPVACDWSTPARDYLRASAATLRGGLSHQSLPFNTLVEDLGLARDVSRPPLVQVLMTEQMSHPPPAFGTLHLRPITGEARAARMDLYLSVEWTAQGALTLDLEYCDALYDRARAAAVVEAVAQAIRACVAHPDAPLHRIVMGQVPVASALVGATLPQHPDDGLAARFRRVAQAAPDALAIIAATADGQTDQPVRWTYGALANRAQSIARRLRASGIGAGDLVAVDMRRSAECLAAILGIVLADAAYLPLDAEHPDPRWPEMLGDAGVRLILRHAATAGRTGPGPETGPPTLRVDQLDQDANVSASAAPHDAVWDNLSGNDRAGYVMFTSGSTGRPKAVAVGQNAILRLVDGVGAAAPAGAAIAPKVMLAASSVGFDAATLEIWLPLLSGATMAIVAPDLQTPDALAAFVAHSGVDTAWFTSGLFNTLVDAIPQALAQIDTVIAGGDRLSPAHVGRLLDAMASAGRDRGRVLNGFGPTETTTFATLHAMRPGDVLPGQIPLGLPLGGTELRLLDDNLHPVPPGAVAEIVIGGAGVAAGYLGAPEMTQARFVTLADGGGRFYRTGDLGRIAEDGTLRYLGRRDDQIKLRGFRIELAEVEAALAAQPGVLAAAAALKQIGPTLQLVGYVVAADPAPATSTLLAALELRLPDYMMPGRIVRIAALPIGRNGKLDRAALPEPADAALPIDMAPESAAERLLATVWAETLAIDVAQVGRGSDFFALGGDSILAMQVAHRLSAQGWDLSLVDLIRHQRLQSVASRLRPTKAAAAVLMDAPGAVALSPIQARLLVPGSALQPRFTQAVWLALESAFDRAAIVTALNRLVARHAALGFRLGNDGATLVPGREFVMQDFSEGTEPANVEHEVLDKIDLEHGPVIAAGLIMGRSGAQLFLAAHHAVIDIAGWRFLLADLATFLTEPETTQGPGPSWRAYLSDLDALAQKRAQDVHTLPPPSEIHEDWQEPPRTKTSDLRKATGIVTAAQAKPLMALIDTVPGARLEDAIVAGLSAALAAQIGPTAARRIDLERHGRDLPGVRAVGLIGWCTTFSPILLDAIPDPRADDLARAAGARAGMALDGKLWLAWQSLAADPATRQRAAAVPRAWGLVNLQRADQSDHDQAVASGPLRLLDRTPAHTEAPDLIRSHPVELAARLERGELHFDLLADPLAGAAETILEGLIGFLGTLSQSDTAQGLHVADVRVFPAAPFDQSQLDRALGQMVQTHPGAAARDVMPLAPQQLGMMLESLDAADPNQHLEQVRLRFDQRLDGPRMTTAWARVVAAHPVLRTALVEDGGTWAQIVIRDPPGTLAISDLTGDAAARADLRPFNRAARGLWRLTLAQEGHVLVLTVHHAILDGWSMARILADLQSSYADPNWVPAHDPGMGPYLNWLTQRDLAKAEGFWSEWVADLPAWSRVHRSDPSPQTARKALTLPLPAALISALEQVARSASVSTAAVFQTAFAATLMADEGREKTAIFLTDAGRPASLPELADAAGLFIVTLPVGFEAATGPAIAGARSASARLREAVEMWPPPPLPRPVSDALMVFENYPRDDSAEVPGAPEVVEFAGTGAHTRFALTLLVVPGARGENGAADWRLELVPDPARVSSAQGHAVLQAIQAALDALSVPGADWAALIAAARVAIGSDGLRRVAPVGTTRGALSEAEGQVVEIWRQVLGHDSFSLDERFEVAGGHSLGLLLVSEAIRARTGHAIGIAVLAAEPTVRAQARVLEGFTHGTAATPCAVSLTRARDGTSRHRLLILPGAAGDPSAYRALVQHLPADWCIDIASYDSAGAPDDMAKALHQKLAQTGDARQITVLGHSFGAALGAALPAIAGDRMAALCVLDQPLPVALPAPQNMTDTALALEIAGAASSYHGTPVVLDGTDAPAAQLGRALAAAGLVPVTAGTQAGGIVIDRYRAAILGLANWQPPSLDLPLLILRAADSEATGHLDDPHLGWSGFATGPIACATVPGGHISVLTPPAVAALAQQITQFVTQRTLTA